MDTNPHAAHVRDLARQRDAIARELKPHADALEEHHRFDAAGAQQTIAAALARLAAIQSALAPPTEAAKPPAQPQRTTASKTGLVAMTAGLAIPGLGGVILAIAGAAAVNASVKKLGMSAAETRRRRPLLDEQQRLSDTLRPLQAALAAHEAFDAGVAGETIAALTQQAGELQDQWERAQQRETALAEQLGDLPNEVVDLGRRILILERALAKAEQYEADLDGATTPAAKGEIRSACKKAFKADNPRKVIESTRAELRWVTANHRKLTKRVKELLARDARPIERLVIDGSNLCFNANNSLIGLAPLQAILGPLASRYEVLVVFDASIRVRLRLTAPQVRQALRPFENLVTVLRGNQKADEYVLRLAPEVGHYVVSNDRFADYRSLPAVAGCRVLPHVIAGGRVLIPDLAIDVPYAIAATPDNTP